MSYQIPTGTPPAVETRTVTSPPPHVTVPATGGQADVLRLLAQPWFLLVITAVVAVAVVLVLLARGGGGGGARSSFARVLKTKGDAYAIVLDLNTRIVYMVAMKRLSPLRYMYTKGTTKYLFVPIHNKPFVVEGTSSPCYLAVTGGPSLALELDPSLTISFGLATSKEGIAGAGELKDVISRLAQQLAGGMTSYTSEVPSLPEVSFEVSLPKFLSSFYIAMANYTKSMLTILTDVWTSIEEMAKAMKAEKYAGLPHLGRFLIYLGAFVLIMVITLWLAHYFGVL
jgi:hypothetical protein